VSAGLRLLTDSDNDSTQTVRAPKLMGRVVSCHPNVYLKESEYKYVTEVLAASISVRIVKEQEYRSEGDGAAGECHPQPSTSCLGVGSPSDAVERSE